MSHLRLQAFTPVITMVALFIARLEDPSSRLIAAVVLIALGTAMASYGEVNMSVVGLIFMFASETFEAIRLVMTQILLVGLKFHPSERPFICPGHALLILHVVYVMLGSHPSQHPISFGTVLLRSWNPFLHVLAQSLKLRYQQHPAAQALASLSQSRDLLYPGTEPFLCTLPAVEGLMYLAPACSFWLLLGVAFYEWPKMAEANALSLIAAKPLIYLAAAAMGFGVNSLAYIVIQLASSLTLKVLPSQQLTKL